MKVTLWGTRGSLATPGPETQRYGGNTSCVEVRGDDGTALVLDAGTGLRRLGAALVDDVRRVDLFLTHLHMDHIQGLGFFAPLFVPDMEVHIYGPASTTLSLQVRLARYLSPPLFPVRLRELPCKLTMHEVPSDTIHVGNFEISSRLVCHPGPTVGYRITENGRTLTYLPDHEPALGLTNFPLEPAWTSGYPLAENADLLIHDSQYTAEQYPNHIGWGHSSIVDAIKFAKLAKVKQLVVFHHDPANNDDYLDKLIDDTVTRIKPPFAVLPGLEGATFDLSS